MTADPQHPGRPSQGRSRLARLARQDESGLEDEARVKPAGESPGTWLWRLEEGDLAVRSSRGLRRMADLGRRLAPRRQIEDPTAAMTLAPWGDTGGCLEGTP